MLLLLQIYWGFASLPAFMGGGPALLAHLPSEAVKACYITRSISFSVNREVTDACFRTIEAHIGSSDDA